MEDIIDELDAEQLSRFCQNALARVHAVRVHADTHTPNVSLRHMTLIVVVLTVLVWELIRPLFCAAGRTARHSSTRGHRRDARGCCGRDERNG
jgi:hypothetical protein